MPVLVFVIRLSAFNTLPITELRYGPCEIVFFDLIKHKYFKIISQGGLRNR